MFKWMLIQHFILDKEVFIEQSEGLNNGSSKVCKLNKSIII